MSPRAVQVSTSHRLVPKRQARAQAGLSTGNVSSVRKFPQSSSTKFFQRPISSSASSEDYAGEIATDNLSAATSDDQNGEPTNSSFSPTNSTNYSDSKDPMALQPSSIGKIHANLTDLPAAPSQSTFSSGENISISSHLRVLGSYGSELRFPALRFPPHRRALGSSMHLNLNYPSTPMYQVSKLPVNDRTTCDTSTTSHQMDNEFDDDYHDLPELHSQFDSMTQRF